MGKEVRLEIIQISSGILKEELQDQKEYKGPKEEGSTVTEKNEGEDNEKPEYDGEKFGGKQSKKKCKKN